MKYFAFIFWSYCCVVCFAGFLSVVLTGLVGTFPGFTFGAIAFLGFFIFLELAVDTYLLL